MKKLLQINSVVNTGSTGRIAERIGRLAMHHGWESYFAYGRYGNQSQSKLIRIGTKLDTYKNLIRTRLTDKHGLGSKTATEKFMQQVKEIKPDIVHLHNIHGYYINFEILFSFLRSENLPVVWTLHDCWPFTGHCCHYEFANCSKWKEVCFNCPETRRYPKSFFDNSYWNYQRKRTSFTSLGNITFVTVSKWSKDALKQSFLRRYECRQIYNGVDLSIFKPIYVDESIRNKYNLDVHEKIFLGVASKWGTRKGLSEYVKLYSRLRYGEKLVLVGLSPRQIMTMPQGIICIERTENQEELVALYNVATALVNLTMEDNFPTVNIEALACGTPVITYASGGSPEAVDEETGRVVSKGDLDGIRKAMDGFIMADQLQLKRKCRERASNFFDDTERCQEYIMLYEELLNKT